MRAMVEGIYEEIISELLSKKLFEVEAEQKYSVKKDSIDGAEAPKRLVSFLSNLLLAAYEKIDRSDYTRATNTLVTKISEIFNFPEVEPWTLPSNVEVLLAILSKMNFGDNYERLKTVTPLAYGSLFTGSKLEPAFDNELRGEFRTANRVDMLVSFIKWSGLRLLKQDIEDFVRRPNSELRIITTTYVHATEFKAIEYLSSLPNTTVKISYDTYRTRLHAKAYYFHRDSGFSTSYIGSSNLSNPALTSGLEWNVKLTQSDNAHLLKKMKGTFDTYWEDSEFEVYTKARSTKLRKALTEKKNEQGEVITFYDIQPYPFQLEILEKIEAERKIHNRYQNLIVAATGTGKTVIAAFDFKRYASENSSHSHLLFVAHREEILIASRSTFRQILRDQNFGELAIRGIIPEKVNNLFISIQTFNSQEFQKQINTDFFDFVIVDEFHHAAAPSYQELLNYLKPKILLGLTATPERMDGQTIMKYFNDHIGAELRLEEALSRKLLAPFHYFGVTDNSDLRKCWRGGKYSIEELTVLFTKEERAELVIQKINEYVKDINDVRCIGFCSSIIHADFMAESFKKHKLKAISLNGNSDQQTRETAINQLRRKEINYVFVVDIYNEGVDIPEVDTLLFLRPTESLTIFLQQLGRGLRHAEGKEAVTVLDFIGQAHEDYDFQSKYLALIPKNNRNIEREVEQGFPHLPAGCVIQFEKQAAKYVLENISRAIRNNKKVIIRNIQEFEKETGRELTLSNFLDHYNLEITDIYNKYSWTELLIGAEIVEQQSGFDSDKYKRRISRFIHINSLKVIYEYRAALQNNLEFSNDAFRLMFWYGYYPEGYKKQNIDTYDEGLQQIKLDTIFTKEILELLDALEDRVQIQHSDDINSQFMPLELHCNYTKNEILSALGKHSFDNPFSHREGVLFLKDKNIDVFFVTLNKSEKDYSPTTMYKDYAISEHLFHWQSQSTVSQSSSTGKRYQDCDNKESKALLFVREFNKINGRTLPYTFLGPLKYIKHEGEYPMSITWQMIYALPSFLTRQFKRLA